MNRVTVASWLSHYGPCTSTQLRDAAGVTVKGTPISTLLPTLVKDGYAKKKKVSNGAQVYSITAKGTKWHEARHLEVEAVEVINARTYASGSKRSAPVAHLPTTETEEGAMAGIVGIIEENRKLRATLEGVYLQLGQALGK